VARRITVAVLLVLLAACGGGAHEPPAAGPKPADGRTVTEFELPLIPGATPHPSVDHSAYDVTDHTALMAFYDQWMPAGKAWGDFTYCAENSGPGDGPSYWRIWHANGTSDTITVVLSDTQNGQPPFVQFFTETDDPGDC
jgi:hypothetical protein